jgi:hypothetical protein
VPSIIHSSCCLSKQNKTKRLEKFDKACKYTQAKILGTVVCLVGAMALSFLQNPSWSSSPPASSDRLHAESTSSYYDWILGCFYLFLGVIVFNLYTVLQVMELKSVCVFDLIREELITCQKRLVKKEKPLACQAATLATFPAPLTMCSIASALGAVFTAILQVILEGKVAMASQRIDAMLISGIVILVISLIDVQRIWHKLS